MKKSKPYKRNKRTFRYNYDRSTVEWINKATADEYADNEEWLAKWNKPLWDIDDDGYIVVDSIGLNKANWSNRELRNSYLDMWNDEIDEELHYLERDFLRFG